MKDKNNKILSRNIQNLLKEKNISRTQMSKDLNINYPTLANWIMGIRYPRMDKINLMSDYFNVPKSSLVEEHKYNPILDNIHKTISNLDDDQQKQVLSIANRIKKGTLSKDKKESLNTDSKIIDMLSNLNNSQKNQILGFGMSLLSNN